ncbi:MAG: hypothetical protein AAFN93_00985 [Bacteroidota bacterium]
MSDSELKYFQLLKGDISEEVRKTFSDNSEDIQKWKGVEITNFQEDLGNKVNGRISEKWFYTHMRSDNDHLPRVDILDLLSKYVGFDSWSNYKAEKSLQPKKDTRLNTNQLLILIAGVVGIVIILIANFWTFGEQEYKFCFINAYSKKPATENEIEVWVLSQGESPYLVYANENGCFDMVSSKDEVEFIVKSPYYRTDTVKRKLNKGQSAEDVFLKVDDYALMIHIFSNSKISDWQARRAQLDGMIASDARIYQLSEKGNIGMQMFNKEEFIDKLTVPLKSLKNIEIVESAYRGEQISILRFRQIINKSDD